MSSPVEGVFVQCSCGRLIWLEKLMIVKGDEVTCERCGKRWQVAPIEMKEIGDEKN